MTVGRFIWCLTSAALASIITMFLFNKDWVFTITVFILSCIANLYLDYLFFC